MKIDATAGKPFETIDTRLLELISLLECLSEKACDIRGTADEIKHTQDLSCIAITVAKTIENEMHQLLWPGDGE